MVKSYSRGVASYMWNSKWAGIGAARHHARLHGAFISAVYDTQRLAVGSKRGHVYFIAWTQLKYVQEVRYRSRTLIQNIKEKPQRGKLFGSQLL